MEALIGSGMGTGIVSLVVLFTLYRIGAIKLAQTVTDRTITIADSAVGVYEMKSLEKHSRDYGKVIAKLEDEDVKRSSYKSVADKLKLL